MTLGQRQRAEALDAGSYVTVARTGPEDECDPEVNSPNSLPDASDDPGDDETEGDPVHDGFGGAEAADAEDVDGWPGDAGGEDAEDDEE